MKKLYVLLLCLSALARPTWAQWQAAYPLGMTANGVYFTSEQTGYVVGEQGGRGVVAKTTDSGLSWNKLANTSFTSNLRAVWFTAADTGYVLQEYGLAKTQDAGATWTYQGSLPTQAVGLGVQFTSARTGYVNCMNGAVYKTTNGGQSWQNTQVPAASSNSFDNTSRLTFPTPQVGYLMVGFELFKTSDAGASWQQLTGVVGRRYRAIMFRSALEGYVNTDFGGTYRTTDGGQTWTALPGAWDTVDRLYFHSAQRGVLLSSYSNIRQTSDGGATTQAAYHSNYTFTWTGVHFPTARFGCAVGSDGAIVITRDGGSTWQMHNPSSTNLRPNYAMFFGRDGQGMIAGEAAGIWRTADYGQTWVIDEQSLPAHMDVYGLHFADPDTGMVVTPNSWFYMTHDGGKTFQTTTGRSGAFVSTTDYLLLSSKVMFTTGSSVNSTGRLAKSTDGGRTWSYYGPGFQNQLTALAFPSRQVGYACGAVGKVVRTTDGGSSWQQIDAPVNNDLLEIKFRTPTFGLAVGTYGGIVRTTDGGTNWTSEASGLTSSLIAIHYVSDSVAYVGSTQGELARTDNGGRTWKVITTTQERVSGVRQYHFRDVNTVLAMSEYSVYRRDLTDRTILSALSGVAPERPTLQLYPNPAAELLAVQYPAGFVPRRLRVYDGQGHLVAEQNQGGKLHALSVASLPAGVYVVRVESGQHTVLSQRFSKQ